MASRTSFTSTVATRTSVASTGTAKGSTTSVATMSKSSLIIVGVMETSSGLRIIDANKNEHECRSPLDVYNCLKRLLESSELPQTETHGRKRKEVEHDEIRERIRNSEEVIGEYVSQEYGSVVGGVVGKVAAKGGSKLFDMLGKISRK